MESRPQNNDSVAQPSQEARNRALLDTVFGFKENAPLKGFMQETTQRTDEYFTLEEILENIKRVIATERLFDENNPSIIMCSKVLETVFDQKALHVRQVKSIVLNQLIPRDSQQNQKIKRPASSTTAHLTTGTERLTVDTPSYELKLPLLRVFQTMEQFDQAKMIFTYQEITDRLSTYILKHKDRLFDKRNISVALVENDPLGIALQVRAFHRSQIHTLLQPQLIPVHPRLIPVHPMNPTHPTTTTITSDDIDNLAIGTIKLQGMNLQNTEKEDD